jgi:hypothetical protein
MTMDYQRKITNIVALALDMFVPSLCLSGLAQQFVYCPHV